MQGFDLNITFISTRNRLKTLCAPLLILPLVVFLLCCVKPNMIEVITDFSFELNWANMYNQTERNMFQNEQYIIDSLSQALLSEPASHTYSSESSEVTTFSVSPPWMFTWYSDVESWGGKWLADMVLYLGLAFVYWLVMWLFIFFIMHACLIIFPLIAFIVVRAKYPQWLFNWNHAVAAYGLRVLSYFLVLSPDFPDIEQERGVRLTLPEPRNLAWYMPLFKWLLAIPHFLLLELTLLLVVPLSFVGYCYAVITAEYPQWIFDCMLRYLRWYYRVAAYSSVLCTDTYPSFF